MGNFTTWMEAKKKETGCKCKCDECAKDKDCKSCSCKDCECDGCDCGHGKKEDKKEDNKESKGLTAAQKKLPKALQNAILAKKKK